MSGSEHLQHLTDHNAIRDLTDHNAIRDLTDHSAIRDLADHNAIRDLTDHSAIRDLALRYCAAVDRRDWRLLGEVFQPDAAVGVPRSDLMRGADEIVARYRRGLSRLDATHHMVTNHEIIVDGDSARHSCLVHAQHVRHDAVGGPNFTIGGRYEDQLVRTSKGWRFKHRELIITWTEGNPRVLSGSADGLSPPRGAASCFPLLFAALKGRSGLLPAHFRCAQGPLGLWGLAQRLSRFP